MLEMHALHWLTHDGFISCRLVLGILVSYILVGTEVCALQARKICPDLRHVSFLFKTCETPAA